MVLTTKERFLYSLPFVIVVFFCLMIYLVIIPEYKSIKELRLKITKDKSKIELSKDWKNTTLQLDNQRKRLEMKIDDVLSSKKNYKTISDFISYIQILANENDIRITSITPIENKTKDDILSKRYSIELIGEFTKAISWIADLENSANNISFRQLSMTLNQNNDNTLSTNLVLDIVEMN